MQNRVILPLTVHELFTALQLVSSYKYIIIIIIIIIASLSPLCRVAIHIFPGQTMSLGDTLLQLFSTCCLWCLYV